MYIFGRQHEILKHTQKHPNIAILIFVCIKYRLYAESSSRAEGPARAVALLDNMYDAYQFKWNQIKSKWKFQKKIYPIPNELWKNP